MDEDLKFWIIVVISVCTTITAIFIASLIHYNSVNVNMAKLGYQKDTIAGYNMPVWVKK